MLWRLRRLRKLWRLRRLRKLWSTSNKSPNALF
jgi:hypothetical protein